MTPHLELINTGSELLLGSVVNTHLKFLAEELFPIGLRIQRQATVPDGPPIRDALQETFGRADIVLITGGLGPTTDDVTRESVAELLGLELIHDPQVMRAIEARFARRGLKLTDRVGRQAMRPAQAIVLENAHGTAPGLYIPPLATTPNAGTNAPLSPHLFLLPGPPRELKPMFLDHALPLLQKIVGASGASLPLKRTFRIVGLGESHVEERLGAELLGLGVELGYCARPGEVDVRVIGSAQALENASQLIEQTLGANLVSNDQRPLEKVIVDSLSASQQTLAVAESCTGGHVCDRITQVPGASAILLAGFVTYANAAKTRDLNVAEDLIARHGAVSAEVAQQMALGALHRSGADYAIATTGIAGPGGGTADKPVGTLYIGLADKTGHCSFEKKAFPTDRETFKDLATLAVLDMLRRHLGSAR